MTTAPDLKNTPRQRAPLPDGRQAPYSAEIEQAVLCCILSEPQMVMGRCVEVLTATGEEFYDLRHKTIYGVCRDLYDAGTPADVIMVYERLKAIHRAEECGGIAYLSNLPDIRVNGFSPLPAMIDEYLPKLVEKFLLRKLINTCTDALCAAYESPDASVLLDQVEGDILKIRTEREAKGERSIKDLVKEAITDIEADFERQGRIGGLATGFTDLDKITNGLQPGEMIVIAARPSMGKSSLCANIVEHTSVNLGIPSGVISLEMSDKSIVRRLICSRARVNMRNVRDGFLTERDFPKLTGAASKIANAPIFINDTGGMPISAIRAVARRWHREHKIKLLVIDYIQLAHGSKRYDSREREVAEISEGCKNIAKELDIPVIAVCQLNREVEKRKSGRPIMSDLRESGSIEQDADVIGFLYRGSDENEADGGAMPINLYLAKNRNNRAGEDVHLVFLKDFTRFESAAKISQEDMPGA